MCPPRHLRLCSEEHACALPEFAAQFDAKIQQVRSQLMVQGMRKVSVNLGMCEWDSLNCPHHLPSDHAGMVGLAGTAGLRVAAMHQLLALQLRCSV